jgi:hypothetical protein
VTKRYVVPTLVLLAVLAVGDHLPSLLHGAGPEELERHSHRIGWTEPIESRGIAHDVFLRVNDERRARGLAPLVWHEGLAALAGQWSEHMIANSFGHSTAGFRAHPEFAGTGENIAMGQPDAMVAHVGWMESDGHRQNILGADYTAIGIGIVCRNDGRMWATQIFGVPHGAQPVPAPWWPVEPIVRQDPGPACPSAAWPSFGLR